MDSSLSPYVHYLLYSAKEGKWLDFLTNPTAYDVQVWPR